VKALGVILISRMKEWLLIFNRNDSSLMTELADSENKGIGFEE
jgi:hypothetical protein